MKATSIELSRFEPTVLGAVRRYPIMVLVIALLSTAAAVGYTLVEPKVYRARATITVPQTSLSEGESSEQYLDSQVLLMQSEDVADRAASIANAELNENVLSARDFSGESKSLEIKAPEGEGSYGSSIITVSFTWPSARVAQVGTNAVLQAFDEVRAAAIKAQGEAIVASIEKAIRDPRTDKQQLGTLQEQRTRTLVNQQVDLGRRPTVARAAEPQVPINGNSKRAAAIGLAIGIILGAGLAYARASRRWSIQNPRDPAAIYGAPLIAEIPERRRGQIVSVTDIGEKLVNRSSRRVAAFFGFVSVIAIAFVVIYFAMPSGASFFGPLYANGRNLLLGVFFGLELFIFGIAGARRARKRWTAAADPLPVATDLESSATEAFRFTAGSVERIAALRGTRLAVAFVSTDSSAERSSVVANVALAAAESGTTVLAVDADSTDGGLTALLLPGGPTADGFEQVLAGRRPLSECIQPSPVHQGLAVLGWGSAPTERITGGTYSNAVAKLIAKAKLSFDLVLIDSPAVLRVADATELADNSDVAIVVVGPDEMVWDHIMMTQRLDQVRSETIGYIYRQRRRKPWFARHPRHLSAPRSASSSASSRSLKVHDANLTTDRSFTGPAAANDNQNAATDDHEHQPDQTHGQDGSWRWPPWESTAADERDNSGHLVKRARG